MQLLKIIISFIRENKINTKVISCKIVREKSGIPYSSRNLLLSSKEKLIASKIYRLLVTQKRNLIRQKITLNKIKNKILSLGSIKIDYLEVLDINKLTKPFKKTKKYKIFIAYYLGTIRLIDNI